MHANDMSLTVINRRRALDTAKQGNEVHSSLDVYKKREHWLTNNYFIAQPSREAYLIRTTRD